MEINIIWEKLEHTTVHNDHPGKRESHDNIFRYGKFHQVQWNDPFHIIMQREHKKS